MNYLITGGMGFLGSHLANQLLSDGHSVWTIDRFSNLDRVGRIKRPSTTNNLSHILIDLLDPTALHSLQDIKFDCIFHLIRAPGDAYNYTNHVGGFRDEVETLLRVLDFSERYSAERLVFASSSSVYGPQSTELLEERMVPSPSTQFGLNKYIGENYCQLYSQNYHLETVCLRYFNLYGPDSLPSDLHPSVINKFINQVLSKEPITIYGNGLQSRAFLHIRDAVSLTIRAGQDDLLDRHSIYNVGALDQISILSLANIINSEVFHVSPNPRYFMDEFHKVADTTKATRDFSWEPRIGLQQGLRELLLMDKTSPWPRGVEE